VKSLPRCWSRRWPSIEAEWDLSPTARGHLFAKLLIFKNQRELQRWWHRGLKKPGLGRYTVGAVNGLFRWSERHRANNGWSPRMTYTDPRYFCVIGLAKTHLTMEVICHEAVHAGFCYAKRVKRTPWMDAKAFDEEEVAYPAGVIARKINAILYAAKLYPKEQSRRTQAR